MQTQQQTLPKSLDRLVQLISKAIDLEGKITPARAKELVLQADVQVEDMMHYADFDHPKADCYGRKLVFDNGNFEVMVMSWEPGDYSSIHNHGYTQWGVVQVFGNVHHFIYQVKNGVLDFAKREILPTGAAIKVNNPFIHQMGNPSTDRYLTLHVYGSNERSSDITADAMNFDLEFDRISHTTGGAFFNLPADEIYDFEEAPRPTDEVFFHYAHLLLNYYNRQEATPRMQELKANLLTKMQERLLN